MRTSVRAKVTEGVGWEKVGSCEETTTRCEMCRHEVRGTCVLR